MRAFAIRTPTVERESADLVKVVPASEREFHQKGRMTDYLRYTPLHCRLRPDLDHDETPDD